MEFVNLTTAWNGTRSQLTVTASLEGYDSCKIQVGYFPNVYTFEGTDKLELSDLAHGEFSSLYLRAVAIRDGEEVVETEKFETIALPHPILGIVKTCDETKYIVDILQRKGSACPTRWQGRVVTKAPCYGSVTYTVDLEGSLDQGTITYNFQSVDEFNKATSHTSSTPGVTYNVGGEQVTLQRFVDVKIGSKITTLQNYFMAFCPNYNKSLTIPSNVTTINLGFLRECTTFNQPITIPDSVTSIGNFFLSYCSSLNSPIVLPKKCDFTAYYFLISARAFNAPITFPEEVTNPDSSFGTWFLTSAQFFNQPIVLPRNLTAIGHYFMNGCTAFNSPIDVPDTVTKITGEDFLARCTSFNQPLPFTKNLTAIVGRSLSYGFLGNCSSFNQPLDFSNLEEVDDRFMWYWSSYNHPMSFPKLKTITGDRSAIYGCGALDSPLDFPELEEVNSLFMHTLGSFNQPITFPKLKKLTGTLIGQCYEFNSPVSLPALETLQINVSGGIVYKCRGFNSVIEIPSLKEIISNNKNYPYIGENEVSWQDELERYGVQVPSKIVLPDEPVTITIPDNDTSQMRFCEEYASNLRDPGVPAFVTDDMCTYLEGGASAQFLELFPDILTTYRFRRLRPVPSVSNLVAALDSGKAEEYFPVGTEIDNINSNGVNWPLVVGHYKDIKKDGITYKAVGLIHKYACYSRVYWSVSPAPYSESRIHTILNGNNFASLYCSPELLEYLQEVPIVCDDMSNIETVMAKWFVLSASEVNGTSGNIAEGETWDIYKEWMNDAPATDGPSDGRIALSREDGEPVIHWLRTRIASYNGVGIETAGDIRSSSLNANYNARPACWLLQRNPKVDLDYYVDDTLYAETRVPAGEPVADPVEIPHRAGTTDEYWAEEYEIPDPPVPPHNDDSQVAFFPLNGTPPEFKQVKNGEKIEQPEDPTPPKGSVFHGWYENE